MTTVNTYTLWADSKYRESGTNANPSFEFDYVPVLNNPNHYFEVEVLSAEIPFSFHSLQAPTNVIPYTFTIPQHSINTSGNIIIPPGNYSIITLLQELDTQIQAIFDAQGLNPNQQPTLSFTYDRTSARATLALTSVPNNDTFTFTLRWTIADIIATYFGFDYLNDTVLSYNTSGVVTSTNYVSPNSVNVSPINALYLRSDGLSQALTQQERLVENYTTVSNVLAKVPVTVAFNTWIFYTTFGTRVRLRNNEIERFNLYWTGLTFDPILFEGVSWRVQIAFYEIQPVWYSDLTRTIADETQRRAQEIQQLQMQRQALLDRADNKLKKIRRTIQS